MKTHYKWIAACALALLVAAPPSDAAKAKATVKAKPATSFACMHCGKKLAIKSAADLKKTCWVCKCGLPAAKCKPAK